MIIPEPEPTMLGYNPAHGGRTKCGTQSTATLDGRFGRRCAACAPWLELAKAGLTAEAFDLLSAYLGRRAA